MERITVIESGVGLDLDISAYSCCWTAMSIVR